MSDDKTGIEQAQMFIETAEEELSIMAKKFGLRTSKEKLEETLSVIADYCDNCQNCDSGPCLLWDFRVNVKDIPYPESIKYNKGKISCKHS